MDMIPQPQLSRERAPEALPPLASATLPQNVVDLFEDLRFCLDKPLGMMFRRSEVAAFETLISMHLVHLEVIDEHNVCILRLGPSPAGGYRHRNGKPS